MLKSKIMVREHGPNCLSEYGKINAGFEVKNILHTEIPEDSVTGIRLKEKGVDSPYWKNYDELEEKHAPGKGGPWGLPKRFDLTNWRFFLAYAEDQLAGAATIAMKTPGLFMLEEKEDLGLLWDIRVMPEYRRQGVGAVLFAKAADWCREQGCKEMKIETQNTNVPACRFYTRQGCMLSAIISDGYSAIPDVAHEAMLIWRLKL